jgi:hypothetical protein
MRQLTSLDAQFLAVESASTFGHVGSLCTYDPSTAPGGDLTVDDLCRMVAERLHLLPPFRRRLVDVPLGLDLPYWIEDPDFDLDFHIRESAVPPPGDDRKLAETVARIFARPLDRAHPLWELYLIHGLPDGRVALLTKVHHAVVDGVSGNEILTVLLDAEPEGREIPPAPDGDGDGAGDRRPTDLEMLGRGLLGLPRQPVRALKALPRTPLVAMVPVSVRAPEHAGTFGNRISAMIVPIPTDVADPRQRLLRAHELLKSAKANHAALPADLLTDATSFIPPAVAALAARTVTDVLGRTRPPLNLVISNVPGPRDPLYCAGALLETTVPVSVVVDGVGLNMTVMSYRDHLDFGIVTDRGQIPDAWPLMDHLREALAELGAVVSPRRGARTGRAARA